MSCKRIAEGIRLMDLQNVGKIDGPIRMSQIFEEDGVHLTTTAGKVFVNTILYNADNFFSAEVINLEEEMEVDNIETGRENEGKKDQLTKKIKIIERELANLKEDILKRREDDCLVTARVREELDYLTNTKKEDRIVVTGLTSRTPMPTGIEEKKKWIKELVGEVLNVIDTGSSDHILSVIQGWQGSNNIPLAEVRMDSVELASKLRRLFANKKKGGHDFGRIYLANSVTLGTRVRIEILKAMAKRFANENEMMYVSAFASRPLLHVKPKQTNSRTMAYTFADALTRYGRQLRQDDLGDAYRRAGRAFAGQMQQNFVVLYEASPINSGNPIGRQHTKRKLDGTERKNATAEKKKKTVSNK